MKKLLLALCLLLSLCAPLLQPVNTSAATDINKKLCDQITDPALKAQSPACAKPTTNPASDTVVKAARLLSVVTGIAAVIIMIIAGLKFILADGDPAKVTSARNTIIYAVVGLVIVAIAQAIVLFITNYAN